MERRDSRMAPTQQLDPSLMPFDAFFGHEARPNADAALGSDLRLRSI